ncbi:hypothetical protein PR202_gb19573 [Eleusine coracana subsp. coracana]|uniref:KIB1-4 beta-propeller domain-containing protein n=1 Tax=Eleusine coracana subsp. coracana TaxID=191504 RepID=A0AAV5F984_ELECO|nr:hypothetical protein PR202_gb19573 [Eleusine coracana subsp. coracana]
MAIAGQKRQGDLFPILSTCKRQAQVLDWASLPRDNAIIITELLLEEDVVDYMSFRAVCASWRASTSSPRDPTLRDARFRPRCWVALCDGDGVRPVDAGEITFFNTSTSRCLRVRLPELQFYRIVGFTDGLVILLNKSTSVLRVIHPFTRIFLDLPPLAPIFRYFVKNTHSMAWMSAAVCLSHTSIAVVVWFPNAPGVICSEPGQRWWTVIHERLELSTALPFQGKLFGVSKGSRNLIQVYPPSLQQCVVAQISVQFKLPDVCCFNLVEFQGHIILAVRLPRSDDLSSDRWRPFTFALFHANMSNGKLAQVNSLGNNHALFLGNDRCISVSVKGFPSICRDSVYISQRTPSPTILHTISTGRFEQMSRRSHISDSSEVNKLHSIRPFTLVDQLLTYCNHAEW